MTKSSFRLTDRDREILMYLYRYRALKSRSHLVKLFNSDRILRRLQKLAEHHFVYRFERDAPHLEQVYALGNQGATELSNYYGLPRKKVDWRHKNRVFSDIPHTLLISDCMVGIELGVRQVPGAVFISEEEIVRNAPEITKTRYRQARRDKRFEVIAPIKPPNMATFEAHAYPDCMFGISFENGGQVVTRYFILEADRATMPLTTPRYNRASVIKKLYTYQSAGLRFGDMPTIFEELYGIPNFRVLMAIVPSKGSPGTVRASKCVTMVKRMGEGSARKQFLFADKLWLQNENLVNAPVLDGTGNFTTLVPRVEHGVKEVEGKEIIV